MKADAAAAEGRRQGQDRPTDPGTGRQDRRHDAGWAEDNAVDALDYADWTVSDARLAVLDAIDARAYANEQARAGGEPRGPATSSSEGDQAGQQAGT